MSQGDIDLAVLDAVANAWHPDQDDIRIRRVHQHRVPGQGDLPEPELVEQVEVVAAVVVDVVDGGVVVVEMEVLIRSGEDGDLVGLRFDADVGIAGA